MACAAVRRTRPINSFSRAQQASPYRLIRSRWRPTRTLYKYRYSNDFKRTDRLWWKKAEPQSEESASGTPSVPTDFCNYQGSVSGEHLPSTEVKNRCCVCLDGWKCQYTILAGSSEQLPCDPDWIPPNTTGE